MLMVGQLCGLSCGKLLKPMTKVYNGNHSNPATATTHTLTGVSFGAASATREVMVPIFWTSAAARTIVSATIDGVSASIESSATFGALLGVGMIRATVPTGTSGNVVITFSGAVTGLGIASFSVYDRPTLGKAASDFASATVVSATSVTVAGIDLSAKAFTIAVASPASATTAHSASGLTTLDAVGSHDYAAPIASSPITLAAASGSAVFSWTSAATCVAAAWCFD